MAFDAEKWEQKRQQRHAQQQERLLQHKKMMLRLAVAAAVLVLCAVVILVVSLNRAEPAGAEPEQTTDPVQTTASTQTDPATTGTTAPPATVIHFAAAGDLNVTDAVVAAGGVAYDYTEAFMDVLPLLSEADLTAINLEGNLCGTPYGSQNASAPQQMMVALKNAGVDLIQMANSKAIYNGVDGLNTTLQSIRIAGLDPVGAFADEEEFEESGGYSLYNVQGIKVAVVAFTKGLDGMALPAGSEQCVNLLYTDYASTYNQVDTEGITRILKRIEKEKPDITIALLHWGSEYNDTHSDSQEDIRDLMLSQGVDAIIGTHPHRVQAMDFDAGQGTFVAYSLGDFFSDGTRAGTEYSVVLDLEITKDNVTGQTKVTGYTYTPVFTAADAQGSLRILRLENAIAAYEAGYIEKVSEETYNAMKYAMERIGSRIHPEE